MSLAGGVATSIVLTSDRNERKRIASRTRSATFQAPKKSSGYTAPTLLGRRPHLHSLGSFSSSSKRTKASARASHKNGIESSIGKDRRSEAPVGNTSSRKGEAEGKRPSFLRRWFLCSHGTERLSPDCPPLTTLTC